VSSFWRPSGTAAHTTWTGTSTVAVIAGGISAAGSLTTSSRTSSLLLKSSMVASVTFLAFQPLLAPATRLNP